MATYSSILAWRTPWTEEPGGSWGGTEPDTTELAHTHTHTQACSWKRKGCGGGVTQTACSLGLGVCLAHQHHPIQR